MAIEKLTEFAKDGQKNVDGLTETDGFPVLTKPARQWFNWLFNSITTKINEIIDQKIDFEDIIDNLTTNDATQPVSAKQAKVLQDNKLDKTSNAVSATKLATARTIALTGATQGSATFDGSGNISISTTGLGVSQTWQNLTESRSSNTNYTNSTGKPIQISISVNDSGSANVGVSITINSIIVLQTSDISSHGNTYSAIVPAGATYNVNAKNNPIAVWAELR